jgi:hypothetical protein
MKIDIFSQTLIETAIIIAVVVACAVLFIGELPVAERNYEDLDIVSDYDPAAPNPYPDYGRVIYHHPARSLKYQTRKED